MDIAKIISDNLSEPHGEDILRAAKALGIPMELNEEGIVDIADVCALVDVESSGRNIFGCDHGDVGDRPPYCQQAVTRERVQKLRSNNYARGVNGVGLTQLTYYTLVDRAEALGGADKPYYQCLIGFGHLMDLVVNLGYVYGVAAYNAGEGNAQLGIDNGYYAKVQTARAKWTALLRNAADDADDADGTYPQISITPDENQWAVAGSKFVRAEPNLTLRTNRNGWLWFDESTEDAGMSLGKRIAKVTYYNWQLVEQGIPYHIWREGVMLNRDGPPAYGVDGPPPKLSVITSLFCAGVGNLNRRLLGLPVPKNSTYSGYNGGTGAWNEWYWDKSIWFDLQEAEEGDIAFRPYGWGGSGDQGHWAYCTGGADDLVIQSYPDTWSGTIVEPGVNADWTLRESDDDGFYVVLIKAASWML